MKLIIAGSRTFTDYDRLVLECDKIINEGPIEIVSGGARGADLLGEKYANQKGFPIKRFIPNWIKYGKSAGIRRNTEMSNYGTHLIAFWDGESKGTSHMIKAAKLNKIPTIVINYRST